MREELFSMMVVLVLAFFVGILIGAGL